MVEVRIEQLGVDASLQPRVGGIDSDHVRALQEAPESWPPLKAVLQDGRHVLVDGFHRLAAAQNLGMPSLPVEVLPVPEDGDLRALAFRLNAEHGRPLSLDDRRAEARRLLALRPAVSNMEVSRRVGLSPTTVAAIRERLEADAAIEPTERRIGRDGTAYTVSQSCQPGELPEPGFGEVFTDTVGRLFTPADRIRQRKIAGYLQRLAVALDDIDELEGWDTDEDAAQACRLVLGDEKAKALADGLGWGCRAIIDVAIALGYRDAEGSR